MGKAVGPPLFTKEEAPVQPLSLFLQRLEYDLQGDDLAIGVPAGVGDNAWILGKFWKLCQERNVTFWLPEGEHKRSGDIFRMAGLRYGYMRNLSTEWIWSRPGSPAIPQSRAFITVQPNRHLEHGHNLRTWYPEFEFRNPVEFLEIATTSYFQEVARRPYVVGFMSQVGYMEYGGNLKAAQWARIWQMVEEQIGPVWLIAANKDTEFLDEVMKFYYPSIEPAINWSLDQVASLMATAKCVVGAHAGPLILSTYMGIPTKQFYPRWLGAMPGTWEQEGHKTSWCYLDEAENVVRAGLDFTPKAAEPLIATLGSTIAIHEATHPRWKRRDAEGPEREKCQEVIDALTGRYSANVATACAAMKQAGENGGTNLDTPDGVELFTTPHPKSNIETHRNENGVPIEEELAVGI